MMRLIRSLLLVIVIGLAMTIAIKPSKVHAHSLDAKLANKTVTGLGNIGGDFEFLDDNGKLRTLADLQGNVVAVFFGFTNCPDVCPGFLAKATVVRELLKGREDLFKVVFVSIDPEVDDRRTLKKYLKLFGDGFIGARIPSGNLPEVQQLYATSTQRVKDNKNRIVISHGVGAYLIDTTGLPREYISGDKSVDSFAHLVNEMLDEHEGKSS